MQLKMLNNKHFGGHHGQNGLGWGWGRVGQRPRWLSRALTAEASNLLGSISSLQEVLATCPPHMAQDGVPGGLILLMEEL